MIDLTKEPQISTDDNKADNVQAIEQKETVSDDLNTKNV